MPTIACFQPKFKSLSSQLLFQFHLSPLLVSQSAEPVTAPAPPVVETVEVADAWAAIRSAVDGAPKADRFALPLRGYEVRILEQEVENVRVKTRHLRQLLSEPVTLDGSGVPLIV